MELRPGWHYRPPNASGRYWVVEPGSMPYVMEWTAVHQRLRGFWCYACKLRNYAFQLEVV